MDKCYQCSSNYNNSIKNNEITEEEWLKQLKHNQIVIDFNQACSYYHYSVLKINSIANAEQQLVTTGQWTGPSSE